jgi:hypothetical protein
MSTLIGNKLTIPYRKTDVQFYPPSETGSPLDNHPDWRLVDGAAPDHLGWVNFGQGITFFPRTGSGINPENLNFKHYKKIEGVVSGNYSNPGGNDNWLLPFAKFINSTNIVGARVNSDTIEIVQRKNGFWSTLASGGTDIEGFFEVYFTDSHVSVFVDGLLQVEADYTLPQEGFYGISGHAWSAGEVNILTDFNVAPISANIVRYNGEIVTYNGELVYYTP